MATFTVACTECGEDVPLYSPSNRYVPLAHTCGRCEQVFCDDHLFYDINLRKYYYCASCLVKIDKEVS